jgi:hypothetical protein
MTDSKREANRRYYQRHPEKKQEERKRYREKHPEKVKIANAAYYQTHKDYYNNYYKPYRAKERELVFQHYGKVCSGCGISDYRVLTIDHTDGGGCAHRKRIKMPLYRWLIRNGFPNGFRTLCHNCQHLARMKYSLSRNTGVAG